MTLDLSSGSLSNLSSSYPYLQGVEISTQAQYDAGLIKIWSGEAAHHCAQLSFDGSNGIVTSPFSDGVSTSFNTFSSEAVGFNTNVQFPVLQYPLQNVSENSRSTVRTFLYKTSTIRANDGTKVKYRLDPDIASTTLSTVIEPLAIRLQPSFYSSNVPVNPHVVRGSVTGATDGTHVTSERVLTVDTFNTSTKPATFNDTITLATGRSYVKSVVILAFNDSKYSRNVPPSSYDTNNILKALGLMSGSTDNYVRYDEVSAACGWYYDNNTGVGTDSNAFGGMTY